MNYRINSLLFDQPAGHWNPQRDPYPSSTFVSQNAKVNGFDLHPSTLATLKSPSEWVEWTNTGHREPQWYDSFWLPIQSHLWTPNVQYRYLTELSSTLNSEATLRHHFVYVGRGGYFFSPYEASAQEQMFKWAMQAVEGTLFDWQIGDFVGCTAGDLRVSYRVAAPEVVSVIGKSQGQLIVPVPTHEGKHQIALVHSGLATANEMFEREVNDSKFSLRIFRIILLLWSAFVAYHIGQYYNVAPTKGYLFCASIGVWGIVLSTAWMYTTWALQLGTYPLTYLVLSLSLVVFSVKYFPPLHYVPAPVERSEVRKECVN